MHLQFDVFARMQLQPQCLTPQLNVATYCYKILAKKSSSPVFTVADFKKLRLDVTTLAGELKSLSEAALLA